MKDIRVGSKISIKNTGGLYTTYLEFFNKYKTKNTLPLMKEGRVPYSTIEASEGVVVVIEKHLMGGVSEIAIVNIEELGVSVMIQVSSRYIERIQKQYKVGDTVIIRKDLEIAEADINGTSITSRMVKFAGKRAKVIKVKECNEYHLDITMNTIAWAEYMFEEEEFKLEKKRIEKFTNEELVEELKNRLEAKEEVL